MEGVGAMQHTERYKNRAIKVYEYAKGRSTGFICEVDETYLAFVGTDSPILYASSDMAVSEAKKTIDAEEG